MSCHSLGARAWVLGLPMLSLGKERWGQGLLSWVGWEIGPSQRMTLHSKAHCSDQRVGDHPARPVPSLVCVCSCLCSVWNRCGVRKGASLRGAPWWWGCWRCFFDLVSNAYPAARFSIHFPRAILQKRAAGSRQLWMWCRVVLGTSHPAIG